MTGIGKVRAERAARRKAEAQNLLELQKKVRYLLFGKGGGQMKKLPTEDSKFVRMFCHDRYELYLRTARNPISFKAYRRRWYGSQKRHWIGTDVPAMTKKNFEESRSGTPAMS